MTPRRITDADPKPVGAPADWKPDDQGVCHALWVRTEVIDGITYKRSAWDATDIEAMMMLCGGAVTIGLSVKDHPVVQMGVDDLPETFDPVMIARTFHLPSGQRCVRVETLYPNDGGQRVHASVKIDGTLADAISIGVTRIEAMARSRGWIE